ncbi:S41 family peptidase [Chitinophaga nivalis]|uniref:S41 family peptidase n=1 Tax=Chitinophaga nivalis TaxID=2991709 RepID=A0ABT3IPB0_9BACT|nr:S41 family peptidase [Chitinophaga nivalis]MCW3464504.1 S41 family peptidase [Chitinophaga nivalis]MCW3485805.1 S41 family peptidase [Chitinophaga nivalis]
MYLLSKKHCIRLLLLLWGLFPNKGNSQTIAYYYVQKADTVFSLWQQQHLNKVSSYFPSYGEHPLLQHGVLVTDNSVFPVTNSYRTDTSRNMVFFTRYKTENISRIKFLLRTHQDTVLIKEISLRGDGIQAPLTQSFDKIKPIPAGDKCTMLIDYEPKDSSRPSQLIAGEIWISDIQYEKKSSPATYFQQRPFANALLTEKSARSRFDAYDVYAHFPANEYEEDFKGTLLIEDSIKSTQQLVSEIMQSLLQHYPFYQERKLNKKNILQDATALLKKYQSASVCELVDTLNNFLLRRIQDPHFLIRSKCHPEIRRTPVYTYRIHGKHFIAAVVDNELSDKIPLGTEIISINHSMLTAQISDKKADEWLRNKINDSVWLRLRLPNDSIYTIGYRIKQNYTIAKSYKPLDYDYKVINDSTIYYKVNQISAELPVNFLNRIDSINLRKKLILDLRGNGGGDFFAAAQFASCFVKKPFTYFNTINNTSGQIDSVRVSIPGNKAAYRQDGAIIILVDNNTVCVAELLAKVLKSSYPHVKIVGKEATRGALAFTQEIRLPRDQVSIVTNSMNTIKIQFNRSSIEGTGLTPDVRVSIESVQDLQPYNDKVLHIAISK